jgi:hypothetical protein
MTVGKSGQPQQVFCPNCRGGNPPEATQCMWCKAALRPPAMQPAAAPQYVAPPQYPPPPGYGAAPPYQAPPKKRPIWLTAVIGLIGICVVLGIISAIANPKTNTARNPAVGQGVSATDSTNTTAPAQAAKPTEVPAAKSMDTPAPAKPTEVPTVPPKAPGIGDTIAVGSWKVKVEKIAKTKEFDWSGFGNMQTAKGIYAKIYATVSNTTNKAASVNSFDWKLQDSQGAEYDSCSELGCFSLPDKEKRTSFNSDIPPRTDAQILGLFDVAADAKGLVLVIERDTKITLGDLP